MLGYDYFYNASMRAMVASFGYLFSDIYIKRRQKDGTSKLIKIPLHFGSQDRIYTYKNTSTNGAVSSWPRLAFDFTVSGVADNRKTSKNAISQISKMSSDWMRNFVPYDFNFNLYVGTTDIEDSLQIVEQILPFFQPALTLKIKPLEAYPDFVTDVTVKLNSVENEFQTDGDLTEDSAYYWTLSFTLEGFLFAPVQTNGIGIIDAAKVNILDWGTAKENVQGVFEDTYNIDPTIDPKC